MCPREKSRQQVRLAVGGGVVEGFGMVFQILNGPKTRYLGGREASAAWEWPMSSRQLGSSLGPKGQGSSRRSGCCCVEKRAVIGSRSISTLTQMAKGRAWFGKSTEIAGQRGAAGLLGGSQPCISRSTARPAISRIAPRTVEMTRW